MESLSPLILELMVAHAIELLRQGQELLQGTGVAGQPHWDRQVTSFFNMVPADIKAKIHYLES